MKPGSIPTKTPTGRLLIWMIFVSAGEAVYVPVAFKKAFDTITQIQRLPKVNCQLRAD